MLIVYHGRPKCFERLIQSETKRLQNEERSKRRNELKRDVENYSNGISKVTLTGRSKTGSNRNLRALQTLANAGSTIHDAYIWADSNSELFPNTRKNMKGSSVGKYSNIFSDGLPQVFFEDL